MRTAGTQGLGTRDQVSERRAPVRLRQVVKPQVCCVEGCGAAASVGAWCEECWDQYQALSEWKERRRRLLDPGRRRRRARRRTQFFVALIFMLLGEGLWNWALDIPVSLRWMGVCLGWALVVATIAGLWPQRKKKGE